MLNISAYEIHGSLDDKYLELIIYMYMTLNKAVE